jgi:hypothetical protein
LVHFHVIIRLDHANDRALAPGVDVSAQAVCEAIATAARRTRVTADAGDGGVLELRLGEQLHTRILTRRRGWPRPGS